MSKKSTSPKDWREGRRMRAWELHEQGWKQKDIAAALGVSEGAVRECVQESQGPGSASFAASARTWCFAEIEPAAESAIARLVGQRSRSVRLPWAGLDD